jgi:beta-hydroxyacyl-ACP dehydratase FabZ
MSNSNNSAILESMDIPASNNPDFIVDYQGILQILPHRYPFLLVDGIVSFEKEMAIVGQKNFSFNEEFFNGHFPNDPVVPGVLQVEALAQIASCLVALSYDVEGKRPAFTGIDNVKFKKPVRPGDTLILKAEMVRYRRGFATLEAKAELRGNVVTEAIIKATMV